MSSTPVYFAENFNQYVRTIASHSPIQAISQVYQSKYATPLTRLASEILHSGCINHLKAFAHVQTHLRIETNL